MFGKTLLRRVVTALCGVMVAAECALSAAAYSFTPVKGRNDNDELVALELYSDSALMINMDTGETLVDIKSDKQRVPASLTKIMTGVVLLDEFGGDKAAMEAVKYTADNEVFADLEGYSYSNADIYYGESVNCYDLFVALMLPSACDAANMIAVGMSGSIDKFCDRMNEKAAALGMNDTHFSNAHGLSGDNNYTTCRDLAKLCTYAIDTYPLFREVVEMDSAVLTATDFHPLENGYWYVSNTNYLVDPNSQYYYSSCMGIKTGTLESAGRCLASYTVSEGRRYLIVTMGAPIDKQESDYAKAEEDPNSLFANDTVYYNMVDHINLYNWAFGYLEDRELVDENSELREAKVEYGENGRDYVTLRPQYSMRATFPVYTKEEEITREIEVYDNVIAPVKKGDELGRLRLTYAGEQIADIPLVATESIERSQTKAVKKVAASFLHSKPYKIVLAISIIAVVGYIVTYIVVMQNKYMKK